jgi:hypothetical protein
METMEQANAALRDAVETRIAAVKAGKPAEEWYSGCCEGQKPCSTQALPVVGDAPRQRPGSLAFMEVIEELREMHLRKSQDYGSNRDPLANVRAGAELVGIEPWRGCLVRVADKIQRLRTFCHDGRLANEGVEDALLDLASYSVIALVMFREDSAPATL